jgi:hypothetical protein
MNAKELFPGTRPYGQEPLDRVAADFRGHMADQKVVRERCHLRAGEDTGSNRALTAD